MNSMIPRSPLNSWNGRIGDVVPANGDYTPAQVGLGNVSNFLQLVAANNLSDLANAGTARTNLGLGSAAVLAAGSASGVATLDGSGKLTSAQIPSSLIGAVVYQGTWNATTNSPTLVSSTGTKGQYYKVATAGTTAIDGISQWNVGDTIIFDGTTWDKIDGMPTEIVSVFGRTGAITATNGDYTATNVGLGSVTNDAQLKIASNLSDLANVATARTNLGLGSAATHAASDFMAVHDVMLCRHGRVFTTYNASADTDAARGAALRAAIGDCVTGDLLILGPVNFDVTIVTGTTPGALVFPAGCTIKGVRGLTRIYTIADGDSLVGAQCQFTIADGLWLVDLWLDMFLATGGYQIGLGIQNTTTNITFRASGLKITGHSDGVYFYNGTVGRIFCIFEDSDFATAYDCVAMLSSTTDPTYQICEFYDCRFNSTAPIGYHFSTVGVVHNILVTAGTARFFSCSFQVLGRSAAGGADFDSGETACILVGTATGSPVGSYYGAIELYGACRFSASSPTGNVWDVAVTQPTATCKIAGSVYGSGTNGTLLQTNSNSAGTITWSRAAAKSGMLTVFSPAVAVANGNGAFFFLVPRSMNGKQLTFVRAQVSVAGTTGSNTIQISRVRGGVSGTAVSMLSTVLTIPSGSILSDDGTAPVINRSNNVLATDDYVRVDITAITTTPPSGLFVELELN